MSKTIVEMSLKQLRTMCGKTQIEIAKRMSITQQAVSKIEHNTTNYKNVVRDYVEALGGNFDTVAKFPTWSVSIKGVSNECFRRIRKSSKNPK